MSTLVAGARADEIRMMAVNAIKQPLTELIAEFECSTGHRVVVTWGGTESITKRAASGEATDIVLVAAPNIDALIRNGRLAAGSRADIARSEIGVGVRTGLPRPDVSTPDALKRAVLDAKSVAYSSGPSGFYLVELFARMGIADAIKDKVRQPPSGAQVGELVARGDADLGFQQISELINVPGLDYLGPLPASIQQVTVYSSGLVPAPASPEAARALVRHLAAPGAAAPLRRAGMSPP